MFKFVFTSSCMYAADALALSSANVAKSDDTVGELKPLEEHRPPPIDVPCHFQVSISVSFSIFDVGIYFGNLHNVFQHFPMKNEFLVFGPPF